MFCIGKKKYVIKSPLRFVLFIAISCILLIMAFGIVSGLSDVNGAAEQQYVEVEVKPGDTLWFLASEYMPDVEVRKSVHLISEINDTSASELCAGQILKIPVTRSDV